MLLKKTIQRFFANYVLLVKSSDDLHILNITKYQKKCLLDVVCLLLLFINSSYFDLELVAKASFFLPRFFDGVTD